MNRLQTARSGNRAAGFTIIELLIATVVFSMVLILITVGVLSFTKSYYRGVNQSNTQSAARTVLENITQAIQFSGDDVTTALPQTNGSRGVCVGNQRYSYLPGKQLWDDGAPNPALNQTKHVLLLDKPGSCAGLPALDVQAASIGSATELLQPRMRLSKLTIERVGVTELYQVTVRVVYGDDDLLNNPTGDNASCKVSISGSQYCAQSELSATVKKRITAQ